MSRRPPDWEKLKLEATIALLKRIKPKRKPTGEQLFEAGANALLEAQWELGIPWPPPDSLEGYILWVLGAIVDTGILYGDVKGKMVFIPEEAA